MVNELLGIQYNIAKANVTDRRVQNLASYININSLKAIHKTMDKNKAKARQEVGVNVTVITQDPENNLYENPLITYLLIDEMKNVGIHVKTVKNDEVHYAVIDGLLVWHGGMNLLGKEDAWDNLIRVKDSKAASELLIMAHEVTKKV